MLKINTTPLAHLSTWDSALSLVFLLVLLVADIHTEALLNAASAVHISVLDVAIIHCAAGM